MAEISVFQVVQVFNDHGDSVDRINIVCEDGQILSIKMYHREDLRVPVVEATGDQYAPADDKAEEWSKYLKSERFTPDGLARWQREHAARGEDANCQGGQVGGIGSIRESEERHC